MHSYKAILILTMVTLGMAAVGSSAFAWNFTVPAQEIRPENGVFILPVSAFQDGKARHFQYKNAQGQPIRFFVVKSKDGLLRSALDACEVCFRAKKGYVQQGGDMICVNCGLKFRTDKIGEFKGGCNPVPLKTEVRGDKLIISQQNVEAGLRYFK